MLMRKEWHARKQENPHDVHEKNSSYKQEKGELLI